MSIATRLAVTKERLVLYYEAEQKILSGQEYKIANRTLVRADLSEVRKTIKELENLCDELEAAETQGGKRRAYRVVLRDI